MPELSDSNLPPVPSHTAEETAAQMVVKCCCNSFLKTARLCLQALEEELAYPEESEAMGEWRAPQSVLFALRGTLECVRVDDLERDRLNRAARSELEPIEKTPRREGR